MGGNSISRNYESDERWCRFSIPLTNAERGLLLKVANVRKMPHFSLVQDMIASEFKRCEREGRDTYRGYRSSQCDSRVRVILSEGELSKLNRGGLVIGLEIRTLVRHMLVRSLPGCVQPMEINLVIGRKVRVWSCFVLY